MEYRQHASVGVLRNDTYYKHVCAMTDEKLRDKSEIAEELAVRDMRIKELEAKLVAMTQERDHWREANRTSLAAGDILKEQLAAMTQERDELRKVLGFVLSNPSEEAYWLTQLQAVLGEKK